ncbi:hypothetical protein Pla110_46520 [Polystyrenella longa]|uniref:FecR protein n=1 Tax=Polystyrenella longa TaxID=2528007 RepID=A0A518CUI1_9PLAN|nr:hypothetical protein [Polystyrenella longa]QDU82889.1 hypothetical protein Pla110_46520 [Polystyrenella longa]
MNTSKENSADELNRLISAALDGQLTDDEADQLREKLSDSPAAQQRYLELAHLDSILQWDQANSVVSESTVIPKHKLIPVATSKSISSAPYRREVRQLRWMLASTILVCCMLAALLFTRIGQPEAIANNVDSYGESGPVAIISCTEDVVWGQTNLLDSIKNKVGTPLTTGWVKIESGQVQIDFYGGTTVLLEGPAELGLKARNRVHLESGKVTFFSGDQPEGFFLSSEHAQVFGEQATGGMIVTADQLEAHAIVGSLQLFDARMPLDVPEPVQLNEGEAFVLRKGIRNVEPIPFSPTSFVPAEDLELHEQPGTSQSFDFAAQPMLRYGFQDGQHDLPAEATLVDNGTRLVIHGNSWKMFEVNMKMTDDLVIEFEFRSDLEGQIHGIGFDTDATYNDRASVMQVHGYEVIPTIGQQYNSYAGEGWQRFRIPVGRHFSGNQKYLYFVADDDVTARAESEFRNVRFFRSETNGR